MSRNKVIGQVRETLVRVLRRERFGFIVDETGKNVEYAGYKFTIQIDVRSKLSLDQQRERQDWIHINVLVTTDDSFGREFFSESFPAARMRKVRKLGLLLAKKISHRPVHDVMSN